RRDRLGGGDTEARCAVDDGAGERSMRVVMRDVRDMNGVLRVSSGKGTAGHAGLLSMDGDAPGAASGVSGHWGTRQHREHRQHQEHRQHRRGAVTAVCVGEPSVVLWRTRTCATRCVGGVSRGLWLYEPVGAVSTWA